MTDVVVIKKILKMFVNFKFGFLLLLVWTKIHVTFNARSYYVLYENLYGKTFVIDISKWSSNIMQIDYAWIVQTTCCLYYCLKQYYTNIIREFISVVITVKAIQTLSLHELVRFSKKCRQVVKVIIIIYERFIFFLKLQNH